MSELDPSLSATGLAPAGTQPDKTGAKIGRYTLVSLLGQGGMGTVYVAHDPELDRRVALKVLGSDGYPGGTEARARFVREARLMAKVAHPNIVTVFDAGEIDGKAYIVMELVEGSSLEGWLAESPRTTAEILEKYLLAGYALAAAHSAGIVHRDFKPANVLVDRKGRVAVTDFGIASVSDPTDPGKANVNLTQAGVMLGTPAFMSPEQFCGERADARTDQFSFAVALYESLYGLPPFDAQTLPELRTAVISGTLRTLPPEVEGRVSPEVHRALVRALGKKPANRFPTLPLMLKEIDRTASPAPRRRPLLIAGPLGLALAAGAAFLLFRPHPATAAHSIVGLGGKCIDATADAVELRACNRTTTQDWRFANGKLLSATGRCVGSRTTERLAPLELQPCKDVPAQAWQLRNNMLVSGGQCANVERNRTQDGAPIILFECNEHMANERWHLEGKSR